jgi:hypothetical protein
MEEVDRDRLTLLTRTSQRAFGIIQMGLERPPIMMKTTHPTPSLKKTLVLVTNT